MSQWTGNASIKIYADAVMAFDSDTASDAYNTSTVMEKIDTNETTLINKANVAEITTISTVGIAIVMSNIINLLVLPKIRGSCMPWATRIFLINLSVSDLMVGLIACVPAIYPAVRGLWPYGDVWCQISGITHGSSVTISIWSISMVGVDRFVAATRPFRYSEIMTKTRCYFIVLLLWVASIASFVSPVLTKKNLVYYQYSFAARICGLYWEYRTYCVITGFYIPVLSGSILIFCTVRVTQTLRAHRFKIMLMKTSDQENRRVQINLRALRVLILTALCYFLCWGPYVTLVVLHAISPDSIDPPHWVYFSTMWMANTNSCLNVFIYSWTNHIFRNTLGELMSCNQSGCVSERSRITKIEMKEKTQNESFIKTDKETEIYKLHGIVLESTRCTLQCERAWCNSQGLHLPSSKCKESFTEEQL